VTWIECNSDQLEEIRAIFNEAIETSTALYDYQPRTYETMQTWWAAKQAGDYPVIGIQSESGTLMGFASYGPFRNFPAYKYTVEHSVYVDKRYRGHGLGRRLLERAILIAETQGYHAMIGVIDAENQASISLHESLGFQGCGEMREVGFKFGRWLNLVIYQKLLKGPPSPVDG
jgi:phosphinothricin acetyltransferase